MAPRAMSRTPALARREDGDGLDGVRTVGAIVVVCLGILALLFCLTVLGCILKNKRARRKRQAALRS